MLFNFQLRPIQEVAPWGQEGAYSLSWFGLTDGWYCLNCGGQELFRYTDSLLAAWKAQGYQLTDPPYVDYQVVRLWEDILEMLPSILTPIPTELLQKTSPGLAAGLWYKQIAKELVFTDEKEVSQLTVDQFDLATTWLQARKLDSLYLREGPRIWLWTEDSTVFIRWNNTGLQMDGHEVWASETGTYSMAVDDFLEEVRSFDRRLIEAMHERVQAIQVAWERPEIKIDKETLLAEQAQRAGALSEALERFKNAKPTSWEQVTEAIAYFEKLDYPVCKAR